MGMFLAASAFRNVDVPDLARAIGTYLTEHGVVSTVLDEHDPQRRPGQIDVFEPAGRWTTVLWPPYFNIHDVAACRALSEALGTVVSAMSVADDDGWSHSLLDAGVLLDKFNSYPVALVWELSELDATAREWSGTPGIVAEVFDVPVDAVATHYRQAGPDDDLDDDEPDPADPWGFVRLWEVLGITYPVGRLQVAARLGMADGWDRLLPTR